MKKVLKEFLKYAGLPIVLLSVLVVFIVLCKVLGLPSLDKIVQYARDSFGTHGYWVVFLAAMAEGILLFNWYLPGSVVVVLGTVLAIETDRSFVFVIFLITLGFFVTALVNYALGRYGWYRLLVKFGLKDTLERARKRLLEHGLKIVFGTYFHPNVGSLTATAAGVLRLPFAKFVLYSALALIAWNALWGTVVYVVGPSILGIMSYQSLMGVMGFWILVLFVQFVRMRRKSG